MDGNGGTWNDAAVTDPTARATITALLKGLLTKAGAGGIAASANTPAIVSSGGDILAANASRKGWSITNSGTNPLFVRLGTGASSTVFHYCLKGCAVNDDGSGGVVSGDGTYQGIISATGTSPRLVATELS